MKIVVFAAESYYWLLKGFDYQWNKYAQPYIGDYEIAGFADPQMPRRFSSMGNFADYPASQWSTPVWKYLKNMQEEQIMILLEDYWLIRKVDALAIQYAFEFMKQNPQAMRFDLTTDRLYSKGGVSDVAYYDRLDIIQANFADYHVSLQAAIWNRDALLAVMREGESPWELEIAGTNRSLHAKANEVYGFRQWAFKYQIMHRGGEFSRDGNWQYPPRQITDEDYSELENLGYTRKP